MTKEFELSRRRILGGLGTIGVAGAAAGLGTSAYLSDTESIEDNTITAGTLDMSVTAEVVAANDYWANQTDLTQLEATADGEAVTGLQVSDVKPGDWGIVCFDISVGDNDGYVQVSTANLENQENGLTEPENDVDNSGGDPGDGNGELQDEMLAEVYTSFDASADSNPPRSHLSPDGGDPTGPEGSTVQQTYDTYSTGVIIRDGSGDPVPVGSDGVKWYLLLYIPETVGNVIQGDSLSFDLVFEAEQSRNNDAPFNNSSV